MATMKDVALSAGVSTATVSRTLMTPEKVSLSSRKRVETAIIETGYSPSAAARTFRRNDSKIIVTIVPNICDPYFSDILQGIEDVAVKNGYIVLICDSNQQQKRGRSFVNLLYTRQVDGMILLGSVIPFNASRQEQKNLPPLIMACEYAPELELPTVHIDNLTAAFDAVNYLTKLGHKRIAELSGPKDSALCQFRHQGYQQALRRANISINNFYIHFEDFSFEAGERAMHQLLSLPSPPTAVFCHNDMMAIGAIQKAKLMGFRVPQDISVMGFDDIEFSKYCEPPLTTISQPRYEIGRQSMQMLLDQLHGNAIQSGSRLLESKLVVRQSTAPPKNY